MNKKIDTKELRVGNALNFEGTTDIAFVELIHKNHFDCRDEYGIFTANGKYEAIQLTEQILYKCNFKYSPHHVCYVHNGFLIEKIGDLLCEKRYGITITSLHRLQNIFFMIVGKELEINL